MKITGTLSKAQADALFDQEAILLGSHDGIPEYRITELFGKSIGAWVESCIKLNGYLHPNTDQNAYGACTPEKPLLNYFLRSGFYKIVAEHNYCITLKRHSSGEAGQFVDSLWKARSERLAAQDAEHARSKSAGRSAQRPARQSKRH